MLLDQKQNVVKDSNKQRFLEKFSLENKNRIIAITGLSKNAGKTSFLNWFVKNLQTSSLGIITTGRDGEDLDLVGGHKKPKVLVPAGSFYSTFPNEIQFNSTNLEIIKKLKFKAAGKYLYLVRATNDLEAEVIGPATVKEQIELAKIILNTGAKQIIIDGSLDRKSIVLSSDIDSVVIVASPVFGTINEIQNELSKIRILSAIPQTTDKNSFHNEKNIILINNDIFQKTQMSSIYGNESSIIDLLQRNNFPKTQIFFPGAITDISYNKMKNSLASFKGKLLFKHPLNIQISCPTSLIYNSIIETVNSFTIGGIVLNSYAVNGNHLDCDELRGILRSAFCEYPIIDISEL